MADYFDQKTYDNQIVPALESLDAGTLTIDQYNLTLADIPLYHSSDGGFSDVYRKNGSDIAEWARANRDKIHYTSCLLYTSPSPRDKRQSRMPSSA